MKKSDLPRKICPVCGLPFCLGITSFIAHGEKNQKIFREIILTMSFCSTSSEKCRSNKYRLKNNK